MALDEFPTAIGEALGLTGTDATTTGGLIISIAIIAMIGLVLSTQRISALAEAIILFAIAGVLTALGWLSPWLLAVALIVFAALFGSKVMVWVGKGGA